MRRDQNPVRRVPSQRLQELLQKYSPDEIKGLFEKFLEGDQQSSITVHQPLPIPPTVHAQELPQVPKQTANKMAMYMRPLDVQVAAERAISSPVRWGKYKWWLDSVNKARVEIEAANLQRFYPEAQWHENELQRLEAILPVQGRHVIYVCGCEFSDSFPNGPLVGKILDPDITGLDPLKYNVISGNQICVFHKESVPGITSAVTVLRTCVKWIERNGERVFK